MRLEMGYTFLKMQLNTSRYSCSLYGVAASMVFWQRCTIKDRTTNNKMFNDTGGDAQYRQTFN